VIPFGVFLAVTGAVVALLTLATTARPPGRARVRRRLAGEFAGAAAGPGPLYRDLTSLDAELRAAGGIPAARPDRWHARAAELLWQAGVPGTPRQWLTGCGAAGVAAGAAGLAAAGGPAGLVGLLLGLAAPAAALTARRRARRERYGRQLVGAFELMARVLRAGQSLPEAFRAVVDAADAPLDGEFARCLHQIEHGIRPDDAYRDLADRAGVQELRIFVVAMAIQRQTGGNLAATLDRLAGLVRTRTRLRQKVRALTAEGRLQSLTLLVLPVVTFGVMYYLNRPYAAALLGHPQLLAATAAFIGCGALWVRNITNFEG
jgi:tight adherence protein B